MARSVAHFSHPAHELKFRESYTLPRRCDMCGDKLPGHGYSYRRCGFDLHVNCVSYPETLRYFFAHPWHDLILASADVPRVCHVCRGTVTAGVILYRCVPCGFAVHPRCSRQPQQATLSERLPRAAFSEVQAAEHKLTDAGRSNSCRCRYGSDVNEECVKRPETQRNFFAHPCHDLTLAPTGVSLYSCALCGCDVHPRCARPPQNGHNELHPAEHTLRDGRGCSCRRCGFDDHEECLKHPETLRSFAHPWHDHALGPANGPRVCDICREDVPAGVLLYHCAPCGFHVHLRCSSTPHTVRSALHPGHDLTAVPAVGTCAACGKPCYVWVYRCGPCKVDLHIACAQGGRPSSKSSDAGAITGGATEGRGKKEGSSLREVIVESLTEAGVESLITTIIENL